MELKPGARLGPYEILERIGEGGMGKVWRAHDTRLDRIVAIKTSAAKFSERFEREARAVAALNHPHICTLYDVGPDYLVLEYVEGPELKGPLPLDRALRLAIQLASALEAAHRKTITHRDLKPSNILVTKAGVKVLDFGLAKIEQTRPVMENDETLTGALTQEGSIVGTLQYMAPEQLQGKAIDTRADIFSFGCVLYEMLTGKRAFDGANTPSVIAALLERPAPSVREVAPASLEWALQRCLAKDPDERWQSARDLRAALERCAESGAEIQEARLLPRVPGMAWLGAVGVLAALLAGLTFVHFRERPAETPVVRFDLAPPAKTVVDTAGQLSPDGRRIVFSATSADGKSQLWARSLDTLTATPLVGTEGGIYPFWSPDSRSIGFGTASKLKRIDVSGGPALTLADAPNFRGGAWSRDDVILFAPDRGVPLLRVAAAGGAPGPATKPGKSGGAGQRWPWFLPDGRHFLAASPVSVGSDHVRILIGSLDSQDVGTILEADSNAIFAGGYLLFLRDSTLMAQPLDTKSLVTTGSAVPVVENILTWSTTAFGLFSASENGVMAYSTGESTLQLTWFDRSGKKLSTVGDPGSFSTMNLSPDRNRAVVGFRERRIWIYDLLRGLSAPFASDSESPIWSGDGKTILFGSTRNDKIGLYRRASDGTGAEELVYEDALSKFPRSWSPDGRFVLYETVAPKTGFDIWVLPMTPDHVGAALVPHPWLQTDFTEDRPQFSPDGRWVIYDSSESGRYEVYLAPFSGSGSNRQVSTEGGSHPRWRPDGKEIFYVGPDQKFHAVEVNGKGATVETGQPYALFGPVPAGTEFLYDVSADGQRILMAAPPEQEARKGITVVQNWIAGLKK